jgi:iron complex transport system substrate-binding protein
VSETTPSHLSGSGRGRIATFVAYLSLASCHAFQPAPAAGGARPTIVSLNPCSDAILAEVAAPGQLLAISHFSHDPLSSSMGLAAARRFPAVAGSVEEIAQLSPDVVVADIFLPATTLQGLRDLGIRVVSIGMASSVEASTAQVRELAGVAQQRAAGERLIARIEQALANAAPAAGVARAPAIVWESGGIVAGDETLIADLLRRTGFVNAAAARGLGQAEYLPLEAMVADPPRVILTTGKDGAQEDRLLAHPALAGLADTHRFAFETALLWCGGPTIVRAAQRLSAIRKALPPPAEART